MFSFELLDNRESVKSSFLPSSLLCSARALARCLLEAGAGVGNSVLLMWGRLQDKSSFVTAFVRRGFASLADTNCIKANKSKGKVMWAEFQLTDSWHFPSSFREREVSMM